MSFTSIPTRSNGPQIMNTWFNVLRSAGLALETGVAVKNDFTVANNQSSAASVTSALLSSSEYTSAQIYAEILRGSTMQIVLIFLYYNGSSWSCETFGLCGADAGVTFTVDAGQLKYTSTNTSAGTMKWWFQNKMAV